MLTLNVQTALPVSISLLWHPASAGPNMQAEEPIALSGKSAFQEKSIALTDNIYWEGSINDIGIGIPAGTDMIIQSLTWHQYSAMEKLQESWRSFWSFDGFHAYSINFLWGPLLASNPAATENLYMHFPPTAWSVTRVIYGLLAAALLVGIILSFFRPFKGKRIIVLCFWGTFLCLWILFDLRMSVEQMAYVVADWQTYVLPEKDKKIFRTNLDLPNIIAQFKPIIAKYDRYVLLTPPSFRSYSNMRYEIYPSIALQPDNDTTGVRLWVIIKDPTVHVNTEHQLVDAAGKILAPAGKILATSSTDSFLFATP